MQRSGVAQHAWEDNHQEESVVIEQEKNFTKEE